MYGREAEIETLLAAFDRVAKAENASASYRPTELLSAIRSVYKGQKHIPPQVGAKLLERMASPKLSDRELEVLQLITTGKSTQAISKALHITERTVNFHINHILSKLGVEDRTQAVIVALRRGIVSL